MLIKFTPVCIKFDMKLIELWLSYLIHVNVCKKINSIVFSIYYFDLFHISFLFSRSFIVHLMVQNKSTINTKKKNFFEFIIIRLRT